MAAVVNVDRNGMDLEPRFLAPSSHRGSEARVTIRIDNISHIESAYGPAAAKAAAATVDLVVDQLRMGQCSALTPRPDMVEILFGRRTAREAVEILEAAVVGLSSYPVRVGDTCFHLALTCPASVGPDRTTSSLSSSVCTPAGDDEDWAAQYRSDMKIAVDVLASLADGRLDLNWQSVRSSTSPDNILYHEALSRLSDDNGQPISPSDFVPALERLGLVRMFDHHVVKQVLDELENFSAARLGVNISAQSARIDGWWSSMFDRLRASPDVARRLVVEITETAALGGEALDFVNELRRLGCRVALDDFGVGHASVRNALALTPDIIKIDAFFVRRSGFSTHGEAILEHMIGIASHVASIVIVEGVETVEQSELAERHQSRHASPANACWQQGYHIGRPSAWRSWRYQTGAAQVVPLHQLGRGPGEFRPWTGYAGLGRA